MQIDKVISEDYIFGFPIWGHVSYFI